MLLYLSHITCISFNLFYHNACSIPPYFQISNLRSLFSFLFPSFSTNIFLLSLLLSNHIFHYILLTLFYFSQLVLILSIPFYQFLLYPYSIFVPSPNSVDFPFQFNSISFPPPIPFPPSMM